MVPILRLLGKDSCNVIAINAHNEVCFVEQFRFGTNTVEYELPGGLIEAGEEPEAAVGREFLEETGYKSVGISFLGSIPANPVYMDHYVHHFTCKVDQIAASAQSLDDGEYIRVLWMNAHEIGEGIRSGEIRHPHTLSALFLLISQTFKPEELLEQSIRFQG